MRLASGTRRLIENRVPRPVQPAAYISSVSPALITLGTVLLLLPVARAGSGGAPLITAFFQSVSASTVTGLRPSTRRPTGPDSAKQSSWCSSKSAGWASLPVPP